MNLLIISEAVIVALISVGGLFITSFFTYISLRATLKNNLLVLNQKVDEYHKEVNSKMTALLKTTAELATQKGKEQGIEEGKQEQKNQQAENKNSK